MRSNRVHLGLVGVLLLSAGCATGPDLTVRPMVISDPAEELPPVIATFSIVGFDETNGDLGIAVQSKFFAVGSVVPYAKAGVGAVATQASANVRYGPDGLALLADGKSADEVVKALTEADQGRDRRQLGVVDAKGNAKAFTGSGCSDWAGHKVGKGYCAQGNILAGEAVVESMAKAFEEARSKREQDNTQLAHWLMAALKAGQEAGGDRRGKQSAAILVVRERGGYGRGNDRYVDLRVDDHTEPIKELDRLVKMKLRPRRRR